MSKLIYTFCCEFEDGTKKLTGGRSISPDLMYNDFDMFMSISEFSSRLSEFEKLDLRGIIDMAYTFYSKRYSDLVNLHIINIDTNQIIISKF